VDVDTLGGMAVAPYRYRILVLNSTPAPGGGANVFMVGNDVALSDAQVTSICNHLKTFYTALGTYCGGLFTIGARVLEFHPGAVGPRVVPITPPQQANGVSAVLPPQLAAVISWRTAFAGRSFRGRTFLGPLNGAAVTSAALTPAFVTAANPAAATLLTNIKTVTAASWGLVVHSDKLNEDTPIITGTMDTRVDTMRSRS